MMNGYVICGTETGYGLPLVSIKGVAHPLLASGKRSQTVISTLLEISIQHTF